MDHTTGWTRDGKPAVFICQPYYLSASDRAELNALSVIHGLDIRVGGTGWYGHGTVFVELWKQEGPSEHSDR